MQQFAALDALYRDTLKVVSQLVEPPGRLDDPERLRARSRFNQLYWADLPHAGESQTVVSAMVAFRIQLIAAERAKTDAAEWDKLNNALINLSKTLQREAPQPPAVSVDADPRR